MAVFNHSAKANRVATSATLLLLPLLLPISLSSFQSPSNNKQSIIQITFDSSNSLHRDIQYHPEQPSRIDACVNALRKFQRQNPHPSNNNLELIDVNPSSSETDAIILPLSEHELSRAREMLVCAHSEEYVSRIERKCRTSREKRIANKKHPLGFIGYIDEDTYLTTESYDVGLRATAIWIRAVDSVLTTKTPSPQRKMASFALTRPPGHHATRALSNGFCVFNFAAAAALHALKSNKVKRVSILDWDVHYGQGIADILKNEPNVRYVSLHQCPAFPYLGEEQTISGPNQNTLTVPILAGSTWDDDYREQFETIALPFVWTDGEWEPDLVIVSAGYDGLTEDELASVNLNPKDYGEMVRLLRERMERRSGAHSTGLVLGLEGGYCLKDDEKGLGAAVVETVKALF